jgi:hypothetical protein
MFGQLPQVEFGRLPEQSITLHQLLDQFCRRMREQVQSRGIQVRPFSQVGCKDAPEIDGSALRTRSMTIRANLAKLAVSSWAAAASRSTICAARR